VQHYLDYINEKFSLEIMYISRVLSMKAMAFGNYGTLYIHTNKT